jgi:hypothetical protein
MTTRELGLLIAAGGLLLVLVGVLIATGALGWFGRLPGDIRFEGSEGRVRVFAPLTSMLLASAALSFVLWVLRRWF